MNTDKVNITFTTGKALTIQAIYEEIADEVETLFYYWPERTVVRQEELQKHFGHAVTLTTVKTTDAVILYCDQCKAIMTINRGHPAW